MSIFNCFCRIQTALTESPTAKSTEEKAKIKRLERKSANKGYHKSEKEPTSIGSSLKVFFDIKLLFFEKLNSAFNKLDDQLRAGIYQCDDYLNDKN